MLIHPCNLTGSDNTDSQDSHENWSYAQEEEQPALRSFASFGPVEPPAYSDLSMPLDALGKQRPSFDVFMDESHHVMDNSDQEGLQFPAPESSEQYLCLDQDCLDPKDEQPVLRLEMKVLAQSTGVDPDNDGALLTIRRFVFRKSAQLLLGRVPSCGSDEKARTRQTIDSQAEAENGCDDGLFASQVISKVHAVLYEKDGELILEDKSSTHGTFVNSEKIERHVLNDFDRIRLGRCVVRKDVPYMPLEFVVRIQSQTNGLGLEDCQETPENHTFNESCTIDETVLPIAANEYTLSGFPIVTTNASLGTATIAVAAAETSTVPASSTVSNAEAASVGRARKRKQPHDLGHFDSNPDTKRTALVAAALAGMVVGSVGTVLTLASM